MIIQQDKLTYDLHIRALVREDEYPSSHRVMSRMSQPGYYTREEVQHAFYDERRKLGIESRYNS